MEKKYDSTGSYSGQVQNISCKIIYLIIVNIVFIIENCIELTIKSKLNLYVFYVTWKKWKGVKLTGSFDLYF